MGKRCWSTALTIFGVTAATIPTYSRVNQQQQFPRWSWDTVQLHAHCSNTSASAELPFRPDVAQWLASLPFVVIEKTQGSDTAPANGSAQDKILSAAAQLRAANASSRVFLYFMTDWSRPAYRLGQWFQERPPYLLRNTTGQLVSKYGGVHFFDYSAAPARTHWATALANITQMTGITNMTHIASSDGRPLLSGLFLDGPFSIRNFRDASPASRTSWDAGFQDTLHQLRSAMPATSAIIREHDPHSNCSQCAGLMNQGWCKSGSASAGVSGCVGYLTDAPRDRFHEVNSGSCRSPTDLILSLAVFLLGVQEHQYFGCDKVNRA